MSITYVSGAAIANRAFGSQAWTPPATWYLGLLSSVSLVSGLYTELTGSGYARVAVANNTSEWTTASSVALTSLSNIHTISFPESLANWTGTAVYLGFFDTPTPTDNNMPTFHFFDTLSVSIGTVVINTTVYFNPGGINVIMNNS